MKLLEKLEEIRHGHLGRIATEKHCIELADENVRPIHGAANRAGAKAKHFDATEIDRTLQNDVIQPATTEWEGPIVFPSETDGSHLLWVDYRKLHAVTIPDFYRYIGWTDISTC